MNTPSVVHHIEPEITPFDQSFEVFRAAAWLYRVCPVWTIGLQLCVYITLRSCVLHNPVADGLGDGVFIRTPILSDLSDSVGCSH